MYREPVSPTPCAVLSREVSRVPFSQFVFVLEGCRSFVYEEYVYACSCPPRIAWLGCVRRVYAAELSRKKGRIGLTDNPRGGAAAGVACFCLIRSRRVRRRWLSSATTRSSSATTTSDTSTASSGSRSVFFVKDGSVIPLRASGWLFYHTRLIFVSSHKWVAYVVFGTWLLFCEQRACLAT